MKEGEGLRFLIKNNVIEYEALLFGLRLAQKIKAKKVIFYSDSQLITRQDQLEYEVKDPLLAKYHAMVK